MTKTSEEITIDTLLIRDDFDEADVRQVFNEDLLVEDKHERIKRSFLYALLIHIKPTYAYLKEEIIVIAGATPLERLMSALTALFLGKEMQIELEEFNSHSCSEIALMGILYFFWAAETSSGEKLQRAYAIASAFEPYFDVWGNSTLSFAVQEQKYSDIFHHTLFYILFSLSIKVKENERTRQLLHLLDPLKKGLFVKQSALTALLLRYAERAQFLPLEKEEEITLSYSHLSGEAFSASLTLIGEQSGMGSVCKNGSQMVLSMGPHFYPLGSKEEFGIFYQGGGSSKREVVEERHGGFCYQVWNQVIARECDWGPYWISMQIEDHLTSLDLSLGYEVFGKYAEKPLAFVFFVKADRLEVGREIMVPKTLKRYQGTLKSVHSHQGEEILSIESVGAKELEIIPLAGGQHFWGADFLIAYKFETSNQPIGISLK